MARKGMRATWKSSEESTDLVWDGISPRLPAQKASEGEALADEPGYVMVRDEPAGSPDGATKANLRPPTSSGGRWGVSENLYRTLNRISNIMRVIIMNISLKFQPRQARSLSHNVARVLSFPSAFY